MWANILWNWRRRSLGQGTERGRELAAVRNVTVEWNGTEVHLREDSRLRVAKMRKRNKKKEISRVKRVG